MTADPMAAPSTHGKADSRTQRLNMVESQVRPSDVTDRRIIRAMSEIPREAFVPPAMRPVAYMDDAVPVAFDAAGRPTRALLAPRTLAKMIQAIDVEPHSTVLDLAGATGYSSAILAKLARKVVAIEPDAALAAAAKAALGDLGLANASVHQGAVAEGRTSEGPFDAILVNGAIADVPAALLDQLKAGGRLVAVMIRDGAGKAMVVTRTGGGYPALDIFDAAAAFVPGCAPKPAFSF